MEPLKIKHIAVKRLNASEIRTLCGKIVRVKQTTLYPGTSASCQDCIDFEQQLYPRSSSAVEFGRGGK